MTLRGSPWSTSPRTRRGARQIASSEGHSPDVPGVVVPEPRPASPDLMIPSAPSEAQVAAVRKVIAHHGAARVIVMTNAEVASKPICRPALSAPSGKGLRLHLMTFKPRLRVPVRAGLFEYKVVPSAVYKLTRAGLNASRDPNVVSVVLDGQVQGELDSSTQVIQSDALNTAGILGNNFEGSTTGAYQVAIIDSGVDNGHNAFSGRIVSQACFVTDFSCPVERYLAQALPTTARTPPSATRTHVGGIAAGASPPADTRAWRVVRISSPSRSLRTTQPVPDGRPCSHRSTTHSSMCSTSRTPATPISYRSISASCGAVQSLATQLQRNRSDYEHLFGQLQAAGVAVVVAAGNDGSNTQMSFPACLSNAFAIGATNDADVPASFTNSNASLRWWAPGVSITAPVPTGTTWVRRTERRWRRRTWRARLHCCESAWTVTVFRKPMLLPRQTSTPPAST